jgi:hypothetical protein
MISCWPLPMKSPELPARPLPGGDAAPTAELIAGGTIDAELAALLWVLLDGGLPLVVASRSPASGAQLAAALAEISVASSAAQLVSADSLEQVLSALGSPAATDIPDELRGLGLVLVLRSLPGVGIRVVAAHYLRPVERDGAGHLQRRPPAVLAAHDPATDGYEHFAWAISSELAERIGTGVADFERAVSERRAFLDALSSAGGTSAQPAPN